MTQTLFTNITIFDGSGKEPYRGEVLVQGNRIKTLAKGKKRIERNGAEVVDGGGATLMPGLINGHSHIGYSEEGTSLYSLGDTPPEENTLITMRHAQILYDHGFHGPGLRRDRQGPHGHLSFATRSTPAGSQARACWQPRRS